MLDRRGHPIVNHSRCGGRLMFDRMGDETLAHSFTGGPGYEYYCPRCHESVDVIGEQEFIPIQIPVGVDPDNYLGDLVAALGNLAPGTFKRSNYPRNRRKVKVNGSH